MGDARLYAPGSAPELAQHPSLSRCPRRGPSVGGGGGRSICEHRTPAPKLKIEPAEIGGRVVFLGKIPAPAARSGSSRPTRSSRDLIAFQRILSPHSAKLKNDIKSASLAKIMQALVIHMMFHRMGNKTGTALVDRLVAIQACLQSSDQGRTSLTYG